MIVAAQHVDLALIDFNMTEKDGLELANELCALRPGMPMAIITALLLKAGGEVVLTKDDMPAAMGGIVLSEPSEDRSTLTLRVVQVPQKAGQVQ